MKKPLKKSSVIETIINRLKSGTKDNPQIGGLWGSSYLYILTHLYLETPASNLLIITPHIEDTESAVEDLSSLVRLLEPASSADRRSELYFGSWSKATYCRVSSAVTHYVLTADGQPTIVGSIPLKRNCQTILPANLASRINLFPASERLPTEMTPPDPVVLQKRLKVMIKLIKKPTTPLIIVTPIRALFQETPSPDSLMKSFIELNIKQNLQLNKFTSSLLEKDFERVAQVELPGEISIRGGLIDVYPYDQANPIRIELVGNVIESIRIFETSTQESISKLDQIGFSLINPKGSQTTSGCLLDYLKPDKTIIALKEPETIEISAQRYLGETDQKA